MLAEIGHFSLIVALGLALLQATLPLWGAYRQNSLWMSIARPAALLQMLFVSFAFGCLVTLFLHNDFTVSYVAMQSNSQLPYWYKISAVWGGHEGSLLLWVLILSGWSAAVATFSGNLPLEMTARILAVMGWIALGFLLFILLTSNPFDRLLPDFPLDGNDLNPLLQDIGLIMHPPTLYMGYVGFSVVFAFAIAGLLSGQLDSAWARWSRPWTLIAWCFLTVGIALGSWWAYYELGWGGWWFWDPVENASLMPWLSGTALLHALSVTEKRKVFKAWTVMLAILTFSLSLLGTFLVRSGVLTSVHAFANDPERGLFILGFLAVVIGGSLTLFALRAGLFQVQGRYALLSRETLLMFGNLLLGVAAFVVLLGTLFPLIAEALNWGKLSVGPPYFNLIFTPLSFAALALMGIAPSIQWKKQNLSELLVSLRGLLIVSIIVGLVLPWLYFDKLYWQVVLASIFSSWLLLSLLKDIFNKTRHQQNIFLGLLNLSRSYKGMILGHLGIAILVLGVAYTSFYSSEKNVRLHTQESVTIGDFRYVWMGVETIQKQNYQSKRGQVDVYRGDALYSRLHPEKRVYPVRQNTMTEAAIDAGLMRDLYVAMGDSFEDGAWALRISHKPFVRWIWLGALISALGGAVVLTDKRYHRSSNRLNAPA